MSVTTGQAKRPTVDEVRRELKKEVILYALGCLKEQGLIGSGVYENAVELALKH